MVAKAGSEMPEAARRIFYDSTASITPAIHDRSLLFTFRLHSETWATLSGTDDDDSEDNDDDGRIYRDPPPPPRPPLPMCDEVEW